MAHRFSPSLCFSWKRDSQFGNLSLLDCLQRSKGSPVRGVCHGSLLRAFVHRLWTGAGAQWTSQWRKTHSAKHPPGVWLCAARACSSVDPTIKLSQNILEKTSLERSGEYSEVTAFYVQWTILFDQMHFNAECSRQWFLFGLQQSRFCLKKTIESTMNPRYNQDELFGLVQDYQFRICHKWTLEIQVVACRAWRCRDELAIGSKTDFISRFCELCMPKARTLLDIGPLSQPKLAAM